MNNQYLVTVKVVDFSQAGGLSPAIKTRAFESLEGAEYFAESYGPVIKGADNNYSTLDGKVIFIKRFNLSTVLLKIKMMANSFRISGGMKKADSYSICPSNKAACRRYESLVDELENAYVFGGHFGVLAAKTVSNIIPDFNY